MRLPWSSRKIPEDRKPKELRSKPAEQPPIPSITCPKCGWISYDFNDIREKYCGHCHKYHDEVDPPPIEVKRDFIKEVKILLASLTYGDKMELCQQLSKILDSKLTADEIAACLYKFSQS